MPQSVNGDNFILLSEMAEKFIITPPGESVCMSEMKNFLFHKANPVFKGNY